MENFLSKKNISQPLSSEEVDVLNRTNVSIPPNNTKQGDPSINLHLLTKMQNLQMRYHTYKNWFRTKIIIIQQVVLLHIDDISMNRTSRRNWIVQLKVQHSYLFPRKISKESITGGLKL